MSRRPGLARRFDIGLPILECPAAARAIREGDEVEVDVVEGRIHGRTTGAAVQATPVPPFMRALRSAGGLVPCTRRRLGL